MKEKLYDEGFVRPGDFALGLVAFGALVLWKLPPWLVVVLSAAAASGIAAVA